MKLWNLKTQQYEKNIHNMVIPDNIDHMSHISPSSSHHQMAPSDGPMSLDTIINQMTAANSPTTLNHTLCNGLPKESPNTILQCIEGMTYAGETR